MKKFLIVLIAINVLIVSSSFGLAPVEILNEAGIIKGDGTGYAEDKPLTREEMVTILVRMNPDSNFKNFDYSGKSGFTDVPNDHWAAPYIAFAKEKGITNGIGNGKFGLSQNINGRQSIIFMAKNLGVDNAGDYYNSGKNLGKHLKNDTGISLKTIPIEKYDEVINRKMVFLLLVESLRQNHIEKNSKLSSILQIELPDESDIDYSNEYTTKAEAEETNANIFSDIKVADISVALIHENYGNKNVLDLFTISSYDFFNYFNIDISDGIENYISDADDEEKRYNTLYVNEKGIIFELDIKVLLNAPNKNALNSMQFADNSKVKLVTQEGEEINIGDSKSHMKEVLSPGKFYGDPIGIDDIYVAYSYQLEGIEKVDEQFDLVFAADENDNIIKISAFHYIH